MWRRLFIVLTVLLLPSVAHAACSTPVGVEGDVIYNTTSSVPQYCDGADNWIAMVGAEFSVGGPPCTADVVRACSMISSFNCTGSVLQSAALGSVAACETQCQTWGETNVGSCCEYSAGGTCSFKDGTINFNAGDNAAICGDQNSYNVVSTEGSGIYCAYVLNGSDYYSICGGDGVGNETCSTTASPGDTVCVHGNTPTSDIMFKVNGAGTSTSFGSFGTHNGVTYDAYEGDGGGGGFCPAPDTTTQIVPNGLVGHWRLDETSGTTAVDSSGNGNDGTLVAPTSGTQMTFTTDSVNGVIGGALNFGETATCCGSDLIEVASGTGFPTGAGAEFSLSFWYYGLNYGDWGQGLMFVYGDTNGDADATQTWVTMWDGANNDDIRIATNNGYMDFANDADGVPWEAAGRWRHVTLTQSATEMRFYVDGREPTPSYADGGYPLSHVISPESAFLRIGDFDTDWAGEIVAYLDDVRMYNRVLTADEIAEIYQARDGIRYNEAARVPEFFDGNRYVAMPPPFPDVTSGLVGHWKLDETSGTTAADSSGNGNDGTMQNAMDATNDTTLGAVGGGLAFDGVDDYIQVASDSVFDSFPITVSAWFKLDQLPSVTGQDAFIVHEDSSATGYAYRLHIDNTGDLLTASITDTGGTNHYVQSDGAVLTEQWYHATLTLDSSYNLKLYLNGSLQVDTTNTGSRQVGDSPLRIGSDSVSDFLAGNIDDVRIYDRALSDYDIQKLYNMGAPVGQSTALPQGCPNIGDVCDDGTIYAGLSPDGSVAMFVTPENLANNTWNAGSVDWKATGAIDANSGAANTNSIVTTDADDVLAGFQEHGAASQCYNLNVFGSNDWYLPATNELSVLHTNRVAIGGFIATPLTLEGSWYWSSSEGNPDGANARNFGGSGSGTIFKNRALRVRCVRKGPAPRCANPYGREGAMIYNTNGDVVQYCDGARWIAIGKNQ